MNPEPETAAPIQKGVIYPKCPHCGLDPLRIKRVRYDFKDHVLVETIFCSECRAVISAQIVGFDRPK